MLALKRIVTVAVMVYLLIALLLLLFPSVRAALAGTRNDFDAASTPGLENDLLLFLCWIGVIVLGLHLLTENLDSVLLRRSVAKQDAKINELKAKLYDTHQPTGPVAPAAAHHPSVSYPTATSAAAAAERAPHPTNPPATPTTY